MEANTVDVSRGIAWFTGGFRLFMKNPGVWIVLGVIYLAVVFVLSLIPVLGGLLLFLLLPVLTAGLLFAARETDRDRPADFQHVFQGFRDKDKLTPLLALGGLALAGLIASLALAFVIGGGSVLAMLAGRGHAALTGGAGAAVIVALLAVLAVQLVVAMALAYAVPLVMFKATPASRALASSLRACLRNFLPLTVFGVMFFFAAVLATLPLLIGWIVLLPASAGMLYLSYKDLYESSG